MNFNFQILISTVFIALAFSADRKPIIDCVTACIHKESLADWNNCAPKCFSSSPDKKDENYLKCETKCAKLRFTMEEDDAKFSDFENCNQACVYDYNVL